MIVVFAILRLKESKPDFLLLGKKEWK